MTGRSGCFAEVTLVESSLSVDTSSCKVSEVAQKHVVRIISCLALRIAGSSRFLYKEAPVPWSNAIRVEDDARAVAST